ncbi:MAG: type VI secretion system tube protein TssD [Candidatus Hodarchaeales archaeon]
MEVLEILVKKTIGLLVPIFIAFILVFSFAFSNIGDKSTTASLNDLQAATIKFTGMNLWLDSETEGNIEGSSKIAGREGSIDVLSFSHSIRQPVDPTTGLASGQRRHSPLKITKTIDKATPKLYQLLAENGVISSFTLKFYRLNSQDQEEHYFTINLEDAHIVSITSAGIAGEELLETISFTYRKIIWVWEIDGIQAEDYWNGTPV